MKTAQAKQSRRVKTRARRAGYGLSDLMLAVLEDALTTYKVGLASPVPAKRVEAFRVEAWTASEDVDWPFSFLNVCQVIGVSPDYIRRCMTRWRRKVSATDDPVH
jgi:hypothetical protein